MPSSTSTRSWAAQPLSLRLLEWLVRSNGPTPRAPSAFDRRCIGILTLAAVMMAVLTLPWCVYFSVRGMQVLAAFDSALVLASLGVLMLLRRRLLQLASLVFPLLCGVGIAVLSVVADVPTELNPRSLHLFLVPLALGAFFVLQHHGPVARVLPPGLILAMFAVLASTPYSFGFTPIVPGGLRAAVTWVDVFCATGAIYAILGMVLREAREASALELDFARALAAGELRFHLQGQYTAEGRLVGAEALMRWQHPERGLVSPAEFIPMAERTGLIIPAGELLLGEVCRMLQRWQQDAALRELVLSVNVSSAQLVSSAAASRLIDTAVTGLTECRRLKFELTESLFVHDLGLVRAVMQRLRDERIGLSLDDFGTGFSSLSYLKQLPLDELKVDKSFIADLTGDERAQTIVRTIVQLGQDLGLDVVAEGVETEAQFSELREMGCTRFQGYLFARPMPVEVFEARARAAQTDRRRLPPFNSDAAADEPALARG